MNTAIRQVANELPDWRPILRHPEMRKLLIETRRRCLQAATTAEARTYHASMLVVESCAVEDDATTLETLRLLGSESEPPRLDVEAFRFSRALQFDWWKRAQQARIRAGPHGAAYIKAMEKWDSGDYAARQICAGIAPPAIPRWAVRRPSRIPFAGRSSRSLSRKATGKRCRWGVFFHDPNSTAKRSGLRSPGGSSSSRG